MEIEDEVHENKDIPGIPLYETNNLNFINNQYILEEE